MCPYVHPCKSLKESRCLRKSKHARLQDNARHAKPEAVRLCCTQCSKTPVEKFCNETYHVQGHSVTQIMPFSFNLCCLSSGFSENEAAASYGLNRIKSYQVQVMSPVLLIHVSLCSSMQVLERILLSA